MGGNHRPTAYSFLTWSILSQEASTVYEAEAVERHVIRHGAYIQATANTIPILTLSFFAIRYHILGCLIISPNGSRGRSDFI